MATTFGKRNFATGFVIFERFSPENVVKILLTVLELQMKKVKLVSYSKRYRYFPLENTSGTIIFTNLLCLRLTGLLEHVISCDRNLKVSYGREYQQSLTSMFYCSQNLFFHLFNPPFGILVFLVLFVLCRVKIESSDKRNITTQEQSSV